MMGKRAPRLIPASRAEFDYRPLICVQENTRFCSDHINWKTMFNGGNVSYVVEPFRKVWRRWGGVGVGGLLYRTIIREAQTFSQAAPPGLFSPLCSLLMTIYN